MTLLVINSLGDGYTRTNARIQRHSRAEAIKKPGQCAPVRHLVISKLPYKGKLAIWLWMLNII